MIGHVLIMKQKLIKLYFNQSKMNPLSYSDCDPRKQKFPVSTIHVQNLPRLIHHHLVLSPLKRNWRSNEHLLHTRQRKPKLSSGHEGQMDGLLERMMLPIYNVAKINTRGSISMKREIAWGKPNPTRRTPRQRLLKPSIRRGLNPTAPVQCSISLAVRWEPEKRLPNLFKRDFLQLSRKPVRRRQNCTHRSLRRVIELP